MDDDLYKEIIWVMTNYGSDAGERQEPGSKLKSQAERICRFVYERDELRSYAQSRKFDTVCICSWTSRMEK